MRKDTFLKLFDNLPDDADIRYAYHPSESYDVYDQDDFAIHKLYEKGKSTPSFFVNSMGRSNCPDGYQTENEYIVSQSAMTLINSFPKDKYWTISNGGYRYITVSYSRANYSRRFSVIIRDMKYSIRVSETGGDVDITDGWDNFFKAVTPIILKDLQKFREELEDVLETGV